MPSARFCTQNRYCAVQFGLTIAKIDHFAVMVRSA